MSGTIVVEMVGFRNDRGLACVALFGEGGGFPDALDGAAALGEARIEGGRCTIALEDVPAGAYAVSVIHDENENGELDTNALGIPTEGFGFSNNPKIRFGPPRFAKARFAHRASGAAPTRVEVKLQYML